MIGKNNHYLKNTKEGTKVESYSIKKFKVGTASVVIGASIFFGAGAVAQASEEVSNNTTSDNTTNSNISEGVVGAPVATEQPVAKDTTKKDVASAVASKLNATEKETLDKTSLTKLIEEIDGKFSNGKYDSKTEESVNRLKAVLEEAKTVLNNANTQAELTKAQARLATATTQLKTKPTEKKVAPKVDTTNGKPTVGKKAENTEKATDSNSISNSGTRDERNGKALNKENAFRTDGATTDNDPSANQTYTAPSADASLEELATTLKNLPDKVENNAKIKNMNEVGASTGVAVGEVKEIHDFGGWTAVDVNGQAGKFAIARKTDKGVFPIETINVLGNNDVWTIEQSFDRTNDYMLFLSKVRTKANSTEESFDNRPYIASGEGGPRGASVARGTKGFRGIEKVFKAYSSKEGSKVQVSFKTGYTGDINGTKAQYKVEVFTDQDGFTNPIYSTSFSPQNAENGVDKTVVAAKDGTTRKQKINIGNKTKQEAETLLSQATNMPNGTGGSFTSREIELPKGVASYKVRISSADDEVLGMSYQSRFLQYALPVTGLDFSITQNTNQIAKDLLQKVYDKLEASKPTDSQGKTPSSVEKYENKLKEIKALLDKGTLDTTDAYKSALSEVLLQKKELVDKGALTEAIAKLKKLTEEADPTGGKTTSTAGVYTAAKEAAEAAVREAEAVIAKDNATPKEVAEALAKVNDKKADLERAKAGLVEAATQDQKDELANADEDLKLADTAGKTNDSIKVYNEEVGKLSAELEATKQAAKDLLAKGDNAGELEAYRLQAKISKLKSKLLEAAKLLKDIDKSAVKKEVEETAKNATDAIVANNDLTPEQKEAAKAKVAEEANKAIATIDKATTEDDVTAAKNSAKLAIAKELAKAELEAAKAIKEKAIAGNDKLSDDEKQAVKEQIKNIVDEAKEAIDNATEQSAVDTAKTTAKEDIDALNPVGKDKAKETIDSALSAKGAAIDSNDKLSDVEKSAAKEAVKKAAEDAKKVIDKATTQAEVEEKLSAGLKAISDVTPIAKAKAIEEIEKAKKAKEEAIDANSQLLDEEKDELKEKIAEEAKKAIEKIIAATTESHVTLETNSGKEEISKVKNEDNYKEKAKKDVQEKLAEKLAEIEAMPALTKVQKEKEKSKAETEAKKALAAIDDSKTTTKEEVDKEVRNFIYRILGAILDIEDYDLSKLLVKGTVEIEQGKEISDSDILSKIDLPSDVKVKNIEKPSTEQLGKVLSRVTLILVDNSTLTIDVPVEVVQAHTTPDEKPSTELAKFKELAKQDVKEKLAGKLSELEQATNLTESQKQAMVNKLKESAEKAISDIEKASSKEAVEQVLRKFILAVKPEVLEKEEYDLSKELVNGRLVVKRGDKLSDEDILAKINLPKGAEVINIEKPTTLALGKTQARVELKLSDGTIITIEVPIEVIKGESALSEMKRSPEQTSANEQVSTNITSKKLPNTGATETNTGLAGLGLGIFGGLLAVAKRRRERKED